ncbi:MAG: RNA polymerase sigma factor RpoD/SigA [Clostridiales bacterium]
MKLDSKCQSKGALGKYLKEIGRTNLLTPDEEVQCATRIKKGDQEAFRKMIMSNLRFVVAIAKEYINHGLTLEDLICEGNLGLIKAIERYDETKGFKFISYAVWWIRHSINQAIYEQARLIRLPSNKSNSVAKVNKTAIKLEQKLERQPSQQELSQIAKISYECISEANEYPLKYVSLDIPAFSGSTKTNLKDTLHDSFEATPDKSLITESLKKHISMSLHTLEEKEATVIKLYFGLNNERALTLEEIAEMYHISREKVRLIKEKALQKLRHPKRSKNLRMYLNYEL